MRPGMIVNPVTSTTSVPSGQVAAARGPADTIRSPSINTAASLITGPPLPSIKFAFINTFM